MEKPDDHQLKRHWQNGGLSIPEQIEIIDRKVKEIAEKKRQLESIEIYLIDKLGKLIESNLELAGKDRKQAEVLGEN
jgi:hypothetical protein